MYNSLRNIKAKIIGQIVNNVLNFICRTVFIYVLGEEYLGISSLYSNILLLLSVSELGFSSAVTFNLYKPLADNDIRKIRAIMHFYKKVYRVIGLVILATGLCLMPFLPSLMTGTTDKVNIYAYYLLYLAQSVVSYFFFAYKQTLLIAEQKGFIAEYASILIKLLTNILQILVLILGKSFLGYTVVGIAGGVITNLVVSVIVDKRYTYLKERGDKLSKEEVGKIFSQVSAMFLYRICNIVGIATDNLIISANISVLMVGLYNNYYLIINVLQTLLSNVLHAFTASLGNLYVVESDKKNEQVFRCLNLVNLWFIIFSSVSCLVIFQPFITLWIGERYLFNNWIVFIIVMNFATNHMQGVVQIYKDTTGLFVKGKYRPVATVILNLGLSLILVKEIGIAGVFLGSIISRMCTTFVYDAWLIHRHAFHISPLRFYLDCFMSAGLIVLLTGVIQSICCYIAVPVSWLGIIVRGILCAVVVNAVLIPLYYRREEFKIVVNKVKIL